MNSTFSLSSPRVLMSSDTTELFLEASNVAFNSLKIPQIAEVIAKNFPYCSQGACYCFVPIVEDVVIVDDNVDIKLFHPEIVKVFTRNMVSLKVTSPNERVDEIKGWFKSFLLPLVERDPILKDFVLRTFKCEYDSEDIRRFVYHFAFKKEEKMINEEDEIKIISLFDDDEKTHSFHAEYFSSSLNSKVRIPILLSQKESLECTKGINIVLKNRLFYREETNIPLYVEIDLEKKIFFKHPYKTIPFWFCADAVDVVEEFLSSEEFKNIEEIKFSSIFKSLCENNDFIFTKSDFHHHTHTQRHTQNHNHPATPSREDRDGGDDGVIGFGASGGGSLRDDIREPKQIVKTLVREILSAFGMNVFYETVFVNNNVFKSKSGLVYSYCLCGGAEKSFEFVWGGLLPVVRLKLDSSLFTNEEFFVSEKEKIYFAVLISLIKTFRKFAGLSTTKSKHFRYILENVAIRDDYSYPCIEIPAWSHEAVCEFIKMFEEEVILRLKDYFVCTVAPENRHKQQHQQQPSIFFHEKQSRIYRSRPPSPPVTTKGEGVEGGGFVRRCLNENDPVTFENFENDLSIKEKSEILFNEPGKHGYKLETIESIIKNETPTPLFPLTREPIVESVGIFKLKISNVLSDGGLVDFLLSGSNDECGGDVVVNTDVVVNNNNPVVFNFKVSIDSRVDEDDYVYPLVSASPTTSYRNLFSSPASQFPFTPTTALTDHYYFSMDDDVYPPSADEENYESVSVYSSSTSTSSFLVTVSGSYFKDETSELIFSFTLPSSPYLKTIDAVVKARDALTSKNEDGIFFSLWKRQHPFSSIPIGCSIFPFVASSVVKNASCHHSKNERERVYLYGWASSPL